MSSKRKTTIWIVSVVAVLAVLGIVAGRVAEKRIRTSLSSIPGAEINPGKLHVSVFPGNIELKDVEFATHDSTKAGPDIQGSVKALKLNGLRWRKLHKKEISFSELKIEGCTLDGMVGNADISLKNFGYRFSDSLVVYNDSIYSFSLDSLDFVTKDGLTRIKVAHIEQANAGPVAAQGMHIYNDVPEEQLAIKMGKTAAVWIDLTLDTLKTSAVKIPALIQSKSVDLESISVSGPKAVIFQDDRYPPKGPYPTIQESINAMGLPVRIDTLSAQFDSFKFIWETTHINRGTFPMQHVHLKLTSVGNAPGNVMGVSLRTGLPGKSRMNLTAGIHNNKEETVNGRFIIETLDATKLDEFLRPLFGATLRADIHKAEGTFNGNKSKMNAHFEMLYDNLEVHAWNDSNAPYKIVANNSGIVNFLANLFLPKSNPSISGEDPKTVEFSYDRDVKTPYTAYLIQNVTYGMFHTILPDHVVKAVDQTSQPKPKK